MFVALGAVALAAALDGRAVTFAQQAAVDAMDQLGAQAASMTVAARAQTTGFAFDPIEPPSLSKDWTELPPPEASIPETDEPAGEIAIDEPEGPLADDEEPAPEAEPPSEPSAPVIASLSREAWIWSKPHRHSRRLGYLRVGAVVERDPEPAGKRGCRGGWYRIEPQGYVCAGRQATLGAQHPVTQLTAAHPPDLTGLPYTYVQSRYPTPRMYARLPTAEQQRKAEPSLERYKRKHERLMRDPSFVRYPPADPIPEAMADNALIPGLAGNRRGPKTVTLGRARVRSGFALLGTYDVGGRRFGLTTEMAVLPLDRTRMVADSTLKGVILSDEYSLPIAIVTSRYARRYQRQADSGALAIKGNLPRRSSLALTGKIIRRAGQSYLEAKDGSFVREDKVVRINKFNKAPGWAKLDKKWVDVSILKQALVAYEGTRPVYATLVSTGADGLEDPKESHATIRGTFLIHTKHVSVTMDGDEAGDEFDLRDVPYVQYFTEGYALHGAYWHDDFGKPRSHGCVNLAPVDAAWLFGWTDPQVPEGWHAALSLKQGTTVYIHP